MVAALVTAAVTWPPHAPPFAALVPPRAGATVRYPSTPMPAGVMVILVVHCLRDLPVAQPQAGAPPAALAVTVGLHLWRRDALRASSPARPSG
ncbi:branched-chain amino acid ABC transporter [Streptomyces collinus]|uniref:branched-chain amino acid ABC transporter n=1 Tax=Streptomyces collinus TaxID=42684 RepID=UPI0033F79CA5